MRPPSIRIRNYQVVEVNGDRETVISRHSTRWEANRAKKALEGCMRSGRLIVRVRYS